MCRKTADTIREYLTWPIGCWLNSAGLLNYDYAKRRKWAII